MEKPHQEYCPLCHSPAVAIVYGKSCSTPSSASLPEKTCFGGCIAFPDENGAIANRMCPACRHEWVSSCLQK
ncbi:MAG: hypothetical protein NC211_06990 [Alistipes senegalensis]|nr:hypothetical protein [Oxalobacter formigenes]MCM1281556.1 hypothetical protein [Alistipes senegalensis]